MCTDFSAIRIHRQSLSGSCSCADCSIQAIAFRYILPHFLYFSSIEAATGSTGMLHMILVFWRFFLIQSSPLLSFTKCSGDKSFTSLNAKPVKMQKTKMSRTCSTRLIVNSLARMIFNLVHRQKFGISFFQFEAVVSKWIFLYPAFSRAMRIIFFKFFSRVIAEFCAQPFSIFKKASNLEMKLASKLFRAISDNWYSFLMNSSKYRVVVSYRWTFY